MATIRRKKVRLSIKDTLRDYKGFGKLANGMTRKGFCRLANGQIVSTNDLEKATKDEVFHL
ncbi:hypothetical protein KORDIASMS9_00420 [Kordia sp. SMS9]|uniref:hypothetical protein n=1 Tax=Kordia sp. SMS9 TaxID=2282170 RepID=UPI000E0CF94A|nr:hypothetical protein [Kordia sp. SMS9]AXG68228.1 hypothetical protein KORDIASMS9_00420 [Kordia sp. SMS9]